MQDVILTGERVVLRPARAEDVDALRAILQEPSVARWWGPPNPLVAEEWLEQDGEDWRLSSRSTGLSSGASSSPRSWDPTIAMPGSTCS